MVSSAGEDRRRARMGARTEECFDLQCIHSDTLVSRCCGFSMACLGRVNAQVTGLGSPARRDGPLRRQIHSVPRYLERRRFARSSKGRDAIRVSVFRLALSRACLTMLLKSRQLRGWTSASSIRTNQPTNAHSRNTLLRKYTFIQEGLSPCKACRCHASQKCQDSPRQQLIL